MAFIASLLAYLATVAIVVGGLFMGVTVFADRHDAAPQMAAKPSVAHAAAATAKQTPPAGAPTASAPAGAQAARARDGEMSAAHGRRAAYARANTRFGRKGEQREARDATREHELARKAEAPRLFMQANPNALASKQESDFAARYLGYVNDPAADRTETQ